MAQLSELSIEYRSGLFLGIAALFLSFITGIVSGIDFSVILIRALIMVPVFILVGYGSMTILKKYVPELYEVFSSISNDGNEPVDLDVNPGETGSGSYETSVSDTSGDSGDINSVDSDGGYKEKDGDNFNRLNTINDTALDDNLSEDSTRNASEGKMGKHVVVDQSQFESYEPTILAEAVRTMMSKDKD